MGISKNCFGHVTRPYKLARIHLIRFYAHVNMVYNESTCRKSILRIFASIF